MKKKEEKGLLSTKIIDLLPEVSQQIPYARKKLGPDASEAEVRKEAEARAEKAREIQAKLVKPLGTAQRPFPMFGTQHVEGSDVTALEQVLSFVASDMHPMEVYSDRSYRDVVAMSYCDMPVPSMLELFKDGLERRKPESKNRTQMLIGNPGHGKSFMGALQGRLRSKAPVEVFDCGGKNMAELLFEMVLDFGSADALPSAIDKRLKSSTLQALSYAKLKQLPGEAISLDSDGNVESIDWNFFKGSATPDQVDTAYTLMKEVSNIEGLDNAGGNALGMNSQYGPLIRWFLENREGVLDEYNKSREGTDNSLQTVWQFLNGEIDVCTVENPLKNKDVTAGPSSFTFRREDMSIGFFVTLTGNKTEDGVTTRSLNKSVYSRLSPQTLPDPDVADWQHRICQTMVGLPISTIYAVYKDKADSNPAEFGEWLMSLRRAKAEIEGVAVPTLQETLLSNWQDTLQASGKLAQFYSEWASLTDAEKIMLGHADLVEEIDEEYSKKEGVDFRKIKQHLEEAISIRPRMEQAGTPVFADFKDFMKEPVMMEKIEENQALGFGTRLVEFLERMVYEKSGAVGKQKLYEKLKSAMKESGLRDISLQEGALSGQKSVESCLNISSFSDRDLGKQAQMARKVLCDYIRQVEPEITAEDEQIMTLKTVRDAIGTVEKRDMAKDNTLFIVNRDFETLTNEPLVEARIEDDAYYLTHDLEAQLDFDLLVHHDDLMASLALPTVSNKNLSAVWGEDLSGLMKKIQGEELVEKTAIATSAAAEAATAQAAAEAAKAAAAASTVTENIVAEAVANAAAKSAVAAAAAAEVTKANDSAAEHDIALDMAENRSTTRLATTTLSVKFNDEAGEREAYVHIVKNEAQGKALVVGEKLPSKLIAAFNEAGITHINRHDAHAKEKVEAALNKLTRDLDDAGRDRLVDAFIYRNDVDTTTAKPSLAEMLVDDKVEPHFRKYLMKVEKRAI